MSDEKNNVAVADTTAAAAAKAPKITPVKLAPKDVPWKPEEGWGSALADDRWGIVHARARLKGYDVRDIRCTIARVGRDGSEVRLSEFRGDVIDARGSAGLGTVSTPSGELLKVVKAIHSGYSDEANYKVEFWDTRNDGKNITGAFLPLPAPNQLDRVDRVLNAQRSGNAGEGFDPHRAVPQGLQGAQGFGAAPGPITSSGGSVGWTYPPQMQSTDPMVAELIRQNNEMQARHYQEMRALYEKLGQAPPPPPVGIGVQPETESERLLKKEVELLKAQLPKPKSDVEVLAEKMMHGFANIIDKKFPNVGVGAAVAGQVGADGQPIRQTQTQVLQQQIAEIEEQLSLKQRLEKLNAKFGIGVGEAEEVPEVAATPVEPPKPEDSLPVKLIPMEGATLFGQPFVLATRKEGEEVGLGQQIIDQIMHNPGAQEQIMRVGMGLAEKMAEPLMNLMTRLGQATSPGSRASGTAGTGQPNGGSGGGGAAYRAQVVDSVPQGAVDANVDDEDKGGVL